MMMLHALSFLLTMAAAQNGVAASNDTTTPCGTSAVCNDNQYCSLWDGPEGECRSCPDASHLASRSFAGFCTQNGQNTTELVELCIQNCFPEEWQCSMDNPCPDGQWCGFQLGGDRGGICSTCNSVGGEVPGPILCDDIMDPLEKDIFTEGKEDCKSTCFGTCSSNEDCGEGAFCTFENGDGTGYCTDCKSITGEGSSYRTSGPGECIDGGLSFKKFKPTPAGTEACLSQCFETCTTSDDCSPSNGSFCHKLDNKAATGYCEPCSRYPESSEISGYEKSGSCMVFVTDIKGQEDCAMICHGETVQGVEKEELTGGTSSATRLFYSGFVGVMASAVFGFLVPLL